MALIDILPVVLSGGSGSRLWPMSREKYPKQLLALTGSDSLLQATLRRASGLVGLAVHQPVVVCNEEYRFVIAEQLRQMNLRGAVVLEPMGRNTAPALSLAALHASVDGADPVMLVMPADHVVLDLPAFQMAVQQAASIAAMGAIVTFGIRPLTPETGYGYIQRGQVHETGTPVDVAYAWGIQRFVEKPDLTTAQQYLDSGNYLWNSGLFMVRASVRLAALALCRPDIHKHTALAWAQRSTDNDFVRVPAEHFAHCPSDSIDYAVMERIAGPDRQALGTLPEGVVVSMDAGWSDVGAWESVWQVMSKDSQGNAVLGDAMMIDSHNSLVVSEGRLVACCGVEGLVVVETADAVLVTRKDRAQDVKKIVERLKAEGRCEWQVHRKVYRPWGWYDSVDAGARFQVKRIMVKPGAALSLQMHHHRAEHWIVVKGTARVTCDDTQYLLSENESTYIPLGKTHRLENPGRFDLEMIEVQSGSYLGEDDIVRFDDAYGRQ